MSNTHSYTNTPQISIGMPVFNGEKYIKTALDSLLAQTFTDFQIIISDNASTDSTATICKAYLKKDSRIKYFRQNTNVGIFANFKFVLEKSDCDYFMWAACDDKWSPDWLEKLYKSLQISDSKLIFGRVIHINDSDTEIRHPANDLNLTFKGNKLVRRLKFFTHPEFLGKANTIGGIYHSSLFPKILEYWSYFTTGNSHYDYTFLYNILRETSIESIPDSYIYKRVHDQSTSSTTLSNAKFLAASIHKLKSLFNPLPKLSCDYYRNSASVEKLIIVLALPAKAILTILCKAIYKLLVKTTRK